VRKTLWGYAPDEALTNEELTREKYRGIRPAPGYPACPDHSQKPELFRLLNAGQNAGITLTESFAMMPTSAVSGYYFAHPEAQYFGVARIGRDQLEDYARRRRFHRAGGEVAAPNIDIEIFPPLCGLRERRCRRITSTEGSVPLHPFRGFPPQTGRSFEMLTTPSRSSSASRPAR
jgi:hypothetical protein